MKIIKPLGLYNYYVKGGIFLLSFVAFSVASCNDSSAPKWKDKKTELAADTAAYSYQTFKSRDKNCGDNPDSTCTIVQLSYPQYDKLKSLNDSITHTFIRLFTPKAGKDSTFAQLASNFIGAYSYFKRGHPHSPLYFSLDGHAKILSEDHYLITIEVSGTTKQADGKSTDLTNYINWNAKKNRVITLNSMLYPGAEDTLTQVAEQIFRKTEKLSDTASLNNGRTYFFKNGKFSLPDTYVMTNYGIKFLYNPNTIKPFAAGQTSIIVPYDNIRPLIRPHYGF